MRCSDLTSIRETQRPRGLGEFESLFCMAPICAFTELVTKKQHISRFSSQVTDPDICFRLLRISLKKIPWRQSFLVYILQNSSRTVGHGGNVMAPIEVVDIGASTVILTCYTTSMMRSANAIRFLAPVKHKKIDTPSQKLVVFLMTRRWRVSRSTTDSTSS